MNDQASASRFALYLIPPYAIARDVDEIHRVLRKQFGFVAADQFQVHATVKGFFKKIPGPLAPLIAGLDEVFAAQPAFPVEIHGLHRDAVGLGLNLSLLGDARNAEFAAFRERVVDVLRPYIAPDCDFAESDLVPVFKAHITLAFRDIDPAMQDEVLAYLDSAPLPLEAVFQARNFHFLEFFSDDWPGAWEQTLRWRLHKTWQL